MLALQSYEQQNGFSVITADELYYVNGGSDNFQNISFTPQSKSNQVGDFISNISNGISITTGNFELNVTADLKPSVTITATWHF